jgi:ribosomal-protein-alanine N-acetyltransferase
LLEMMPLAKIWHLEVRESNLAAIALYQSLGFVQVGRRASYYADGEAALLFSFEGL